MLDVKELEHSQHTAAVLDRAMRTRDMDNERFLRKVRARLDACASLILAHIPMALCHEFACCDSCIGYCTMYDDTGHCFAPLPYLQSGLCWSSTILLTQSRAAVTLTVQQT